MNDQERIDSLTKTVDNLKKEIIKLRGIIQHRNAELNKAKNLLGQQQLAAQQKQKIDQAMLRFAQRENSFK